MVLTRRRLPSALLAGVLAAVAVLAQSTAPRSGGSTARDCQHNLVPGAVRIGGLPGQRFERNRENRLLAASEDELLAGFRHRPGRQEWIGEHVGKWLHAAAMTYANTGDARLRAKMDRVAAELLRTQETDGYLGTYTPDKRFGLNPGADWDVWVHKYCLLGLLAYADATGNREAVDAARRIGDRLIATFGTGRKDLIEAGTHVGMAATSVIEPMVLLHRATGERRYLDFAEYAVGTWEEPAGPRILTALLRGEPVNRVANGKAYEMLSNLVGLCELYRATGTREYLDAVLKAWDDIVANRLYITGSGSSFEHWQEDGRLPVGEGANICETCVTVTWMQLNQQLLRLLGEARFAEQIERSVYNHLLAAQAPGGDDWCYYTPLLGRKRPGETITCCRSSGPRGVAMLPLLVYVLAGDAGAGTGGESNPGCGVVVNLFMPSRVTVRLSDGSDVEIEQHTEYPLDGRVDLSIRLRGGPQWFVLDLRVPAWALEARARVNDEPLDFAMTRSGYARIDRTWSDGDRIAYELELRPRLIVDERAMPGRMAVMLGPLVLAADEGRNPALRPIERVALPTDDAAALELHRIRSLDPESHADRASAGSAGRKDFDDPVFQTRCRFPRITALGHDDESALLLTPFYAAGRDGSRFAVWLRRPPAAGTRPSLLAWTEESRSRRGNVEGSICDEEPRTFVVTCDGANAEEDWYALAAPQPVVIDGVVFTHGHCFHDGGWFDASAGKPRVQVRRGAEGLWEDVAAIDAYPQTTATEPATLRDGESFRVRLPTMRIVSVRVVGVPACGDNPRQAFSSCGELRVYFESDSER